MIAGSARNVQVQPGDKFNRFPRSSNYRHQRRRRRSIGSAQGTCGGATADLIHDSRFVSGGRMGRKEQVIKGYPARNRGASFLKAEHLEQRVLLSAASPAISGLTLIDADTDSPVPGVTLTPGATIDLGHVGHRLSIRADLASGASVGSVRFNYDGNPDYKIENYAPYDIGGDAHGGRDFLPWLPSVGTHTLVVTPYPDPAATGQAGLPYILLFNVIDSSTPAPPLRVNAGGSAYIDTAGEAFAADTDFFGGRQIFSSVPVAGASDSLLYD